MLGGCRFREHRKGARLLDGIIPRMCSEDPLGGWCTFAVDIRRRRCFNVINDLKNGVSPRVGGADEIADAGVLSLSGTYKGDPFDVVIEASVVIEAIELFESPETAIDKLLTAGACATRA